MKHTRLRLTERDLVERLLPLVDGRVFHVSDRSHLPAILASGAITPNLDSTLSTTFGHSKNSYFRKRGCVSLFDLRGARPTDDVLWKCSPFHLSRASHGLAILILATVACQNLMSWEAWRSEQAWTEMIVPYVESGYKGPIPLSFIDELIEVDVERNRDPIVEALTR